LKFAVNYAPFATLVPLSGSDVLDPRTRRYIAALEQLPKEQLQMFARRWRISPGTSSALLQAVAKNREAKSEEAVALAALGMIPRPPRSRAAVAPAIARGAAPYGPNHSEVAAFIKGVTDLSPIQWLRVLDRRKLVASVTREGAAEPAGVVRSILAAIEGTREM